jgi:hypothetical protein
MMEFTINKPNSDLAITFVVYNDEDAKDLELPEESVLSTLITQDKPSCVYIHQSSVNNRCASAIALAVIYHSLGKTITEDLVKELSYDIGIAISTFWEAYTKQSVEDLTNG